MSYLGKELTPDEYYQLYSKEYNNIQQDAVTALMLGFSPYILSPVLDIGCGSGLATHILRKMMRNDVVGIDRSPEMVKRYQGETGKPGLVGNFWDEMPSAQTAVVAHALHLCPNSRMWEFQWRLSQAGIKTLVVISPLKRAVEHIVLPELAYKTHQSGEHKKTVHGWVFEVWQ